MVLELSRPNRTRIVNAMPAAAVPILKARFADADTISIMYSPIGPKPLQMTPPIGAFFKYIIKAAANSTNDLESLILNDLALADATVNNNTPVSIAPTGIKWRHKRM